MKNREANIGAKASHTSPLTSLPASIWRLAATRPSVMTPTDIKSRENRRRRDVVGKPHQRSAQRLVGAPGDRLRGRRGTGLMNPSLQNSQESCGANTAHTPTVPAKAATARPTAPHSRLSMRRRMEAPGSILMPVAKPIDIPRYLAGTTGQSTTTSASSTRLIFPRRMVPRNGSKVRPANRSLRRSPGSSEGGGRARRPPRHGS